MQKDNVRAFKNELRNYRFYKKQLIEYEDAIEYYYDRLGGVRGVDPSREPIHSPPNKDYEYWLRDKIETYAQLKARTERNVLYVDQILGRMETSLRTAIIAIYVKGNKVSKLSMDMEISESGLLKRINKEIEKALD